MSPIPSPAPRPQPTQTINFWQTPIAQKVIPIATSVGLHLGMVLLVLLTIGVYQEVTRALNVEDQTIIPESNFSTGPVGGVPNPGAGNDAFALDMKAAVPEVSAKLAQSSIAASLAGGSESGMTDLKTIGLKPEGVTKGKGRGTGVGDGTGEEGSLFGDPRGGSDGNAPKSGLLGTRGNAYRIVYLCDASGTMMNVFDGLRMELNRSINNLIEVQSYNVIFFRDAQVLAFNDGSLVRADKSNKDRTTQWLEEKVTPAGQTDPFEAIRKAFAMQPQLLYVLTDGFDNVSSYDKVADEFRKLNPDHKVKVNTILIESRPDPELRAVLKKIATESGGTFQSLKGQGL